jgi:ATP-binding cassette subfamily B protein
MNVNFGKNLRIYSELARKYYKYFVLIAGLVLLINVSKVAEKLILKELIDRGGDFAGDIISQAAFMQIIIILAIVFGGAMALRAVSDWLRIHLVNKMESKLIYDLKKKFFTHIINLSHNFHASHRTGSLIARMTRGGRAIEGMTDFFVFDGLNITFEFLVVFATLIYLDVTSGIILAAFSISYIWYSIYILQKRQGANLKNNICEDKEKAHIGDSFTNIEIIKHFGKEDRIEKKYLQASDATKRSQLTFWNYERWISAGQIIILATTLLALLYFPIIRLLNKEISIGTIAFIYTAYLGLAGSLAGFSWQLRRFYTAIADFQSLAEYAEFENEIKDKENAKEIKIKEGKTEFRNVNFSYDKRKVIKNFNLKIAPGEKVALVGHSGSGKTTTVKLLYRLYDIQSGDILIDGTNITNVKQDSLRSELSIVPQEGILFNDTIYNNLRFSNPKATRKEVFRAMKMAQFDKFVQSLPNKEKTLVGERGIKLSGGEKQRLSIARAILANKKILILDEATSSLDSKTENAIQTALEELMKGKTALIIAHRLSTIMNADRIIVMNKGEIVQEGKHKNLIKQKGIYRELWQLQKGGYLQE